MISRVFRARARVTQPVAHAVGFTMLLGVIAVGVVAAIVFFSERSLSPTPARPELSILEHRSVHPRWLDR